MTSYCPACLDAWVTPTYPVIQNRTRPITWAYRPTRMHVACGRALNAIWKGRS